MLASRVQGRRRGGQSYTAIVWIGLGLAPIAALLVLFGRGTVAMYVAALLAILAVMLFGLSMRKRPDTADMRAELEEALFDEIDVLHADIRQDIASATHATHRSLSKKIRGLYENVVALRGQLDALHRRLDEMRAVADSGAQKRTTASRWRPAASRTPSFWPAGADGGPGGTGPVGHRAEDRVSGAPASMRSRRADGPDHAGRGAPREESWTEQWLRERLPGAGSHRSGAAEPDAEGESGDYGASPTGSSNRSRAGSVGSADDGWGDAADHGSTGSGWFDARAGGRWGSVHRDGHGGELRVGERRAALRRDESGTELRIEDRWAAVRRTAADNEGVDTRWEAGARWFAAELGRSWSGEERWSGQERGGPGAEPDRAHSAAAPPRHHVPPASGAGRRAAEAISADDGEHAADFRGWWPEPDSGRRERVRDDG
ncbi:MAG TPA: hypothetical protein VJT31_07180 [Rugosimonospora sp.]|nr:hypothetical protein [Rugosimonospora sp.]